MSQDSKVNPGNKCSHLYDQDVKIGRTLKEIYELQLEWQAHLATKNRGLNYDEAEFKTRVDDITIQWRNLTTEFSELIERLPFKEWKTYSPEQLRGKMDQETVLEIWYEYADMFHFFMNIGLALGIRGDDLEKLYVTKRQENFDRQKRGY